MLRVARCPVMSSHDDDNRFESFETIAAKYSKLISTRVRKRVTACRAYGIDLEQLENDIHLDFIRQLVLHDWRSLARRDMVAILWTIVDHQVIKAIEHEKCSKRFRPDVTGQRIDENCVPDPHFGAAPELEVDLEDFVSYLVQLLSQNHQRVLAMKRQGWSNVQISQGLHMSIRSVQIILNSIEQMTRNELSKLDQPRLIQNQEPRTKNQ